jgi:carbonic anhydrase
MSNIATLIKGYRRFRDDGYAKERARWNELREGQAPQVMVIACSDSRVEPAQIFDTKPGEIFVVRNVAALVPPFETTPGRHGVSAALEFAVQFLKVSDIVVLGHGLCGGCHAALHETMRGAEPGQGGFIADWIDLLDPAKDAVRARHADLDSPAARQDMEMSGVGISLANLRTFPCIQELEAHGRLRLHGGYFAISDGILHVLDERTGRFVAQA